MKTLLATALILTASSTFAHEPSFSHDSCDVELSADIQIKKHSIEFLNKKVSLYQIVDDEKLIIDGQEVQLTRYQQSLISEYSTSIHAIVPEVKDIALDAIDLAVDGANMAFNQLLGEGNDVGQQLTTQLSEIRLEVEKRFHDDKGFYIGNEGIDSEDFFGKEFEQRIESAVEKTVKNSIGTIMVALGQEMLFSGGDMDAFETRMENFGEQMEHEMESRAASIEKRADALCQSVQAIDILEQQLKQNISVLEGFDVFTVTHENKDSI